MSRCLAFSYRAIHNHHHTQPSPLTFIKLDTSNHQLHTLLYGYLIIVLTLNVQDSKIASMVELEVNADPVYEDSSMEGYLVRVIDSPLISNISKIIHA